MNQKPLIVLVGPAHPLRGGIANFNESFAESLIEAGYSVKIVSFYYQYPSILFPGKTQRDPSDPPANLEIHELMSSINPLSWKRAAKKVQEWQPQMVVIRFWIPFMGPALGNLARQLRKIKIPVIGLVDNALPHESRPFDKTLSSLFFKQCDAFFTLSESVAADLERLAPGKPISVHPHPIYDVFGDSIDRKEALQKLNLPEEFRYILFFGFIRKYKGLDLLIKGFHLSGLHMKNVRLLVAGEFYESKKTYLDLIDSLDLGDSVILRGEYIPRPEVASYFSSASIVAQTYRSATQSGVTQIAYNFDRPMLVTAVGGLPEIVPDGKAGFVVEPDPSAIGQALSRFFEDNLEAKFSRNAAREKERFSWHHFSEVFLNFAKRIKHKS